MLLEGMYKLCMQIALGPYKLSVDDSVPFSQSQIEILPEKSREEKLSSFDAPKDEGGDAESIDIRGLRYVLSKGILDYKLLQM
jgi:hypothetical protein